MKNFILFYIVLFASGFLSAQTINSNSPYLLKSPEIHNCDAPKNISGAEYWNSVEDKGVAVKWELPYTAIDEWYNILHYDEGINNNSLGLENDGDYSVAIRWDANELADYDGDTLKLVRIFVADSGFAKLIVKIWIGEYADNNIYADTISIDNLSIGNWNEFPINESLVLDSTQEYWVGYRIINQQAGFKPVGCNKGDCKPAYSDMVSFDEEEKIWDMASTWSNQYQWNIQLKLSNYESVPDCKGFILLRQVDDSKAYSFYDFIPNIRYNVSPVYHDTISDFPHNLCYKVATLWVYDLDSCFSVFATDSAGNQNYVCVDYLKINDNYQTENIKIYPNPASSEISLQTNIIIDEITFYDLNGREVISVTNIKDKIDISHIKRGIYIVEIKSRRGKLFTKKLIKL